MGQQSASKARRPSSVSGGSTPALTGKALPQVHDVLRSPGQPLDAATRAYMEPRFGHDFSKVRVHVDDRAAESASRLNAIAYTIGPHVVFGAGRYQAHTTEGAKLIAHELTHVVQQSAGVSLGVQRQSIENEKQKPTDEAVPKPGAETETKSTTIGTTSSEVANASPASDAEIDALDLNATAKAAALELKKKHSEINFTSGRRTVAEQAHAMASNIVTGKDRKWIEKTYASATSLQKWVDDNPKATTVDDIAKGLEDTMNGMASGDLGKVSKHLSSGAFDVQPQEKDADAIKNDIKSLSGLSKFLEKEGGLVRWHAQFKRAVGVAIAHDPYEQKAERMAEFVTGTGALQDGHFRQSATIGRAAQRNGRSARNG